MSGTPTAPPTSSNWGSYNDTIVRVEQGPEWLAQLFYDPPLWAQQTLPLIVGLFGAAALYAIWRVGLPDAALAEMGENIAIIAGVGLVTLLLVKTGLFPYWVDVSVGWLAGWLIGRTVARQVAIPAAWLGLAD